MFKKCFVLSVLAFFTPAFAGNQFKLTGLKCLVFNPGLFKLEKCFVKAVSRYIGTFNIAVTLNRLVNAPVHVKKKFLFRVVLNHLGMIFDRLSFLFITAMEQYSEK